MSFESGSIKFRMFYLSQSMPEDYIERFQDKAAPALDALRDESIHGWVTGRHQLDRDITRESAHIGGYLRMTLMRAERKVPEALLRAECRMEELARMKAEGRDEIDRRTRSEIRKEIRDRLQPAAQPQIKGMTLVWNPGKDVLYAEAVSDKQLDALEATWRETMGFALIPAAPHYAAMSRQKIDVRDIKPTSFSPDCDDDLAGESIGQDFLTWLWFVSEARGGIISLKAGQFGLMIEGPLLFSSEGQGAHEVALRRGTPEISAEAKIALLSGKKLYVSHLVMARGNETWAATIDVDRFAFRGLRLPGGKKLDPVSRFQERMTYLETFTESFLELYDLFLKERTDLDTWSTTQKQIHQWVTERQGRK